jgi:predicted ATPase
VVKNAIEASIESLTFSGGSRIGFGADDVVAIVGPNNAGKSATLRETFALLQRPTGVQRSDNRVVVGMTARRTSNEAAVWEVLRSLGRRQQQGDLETYFLGTEGANKIAVQTFLQSPKSFYPLHNWLAVNIDAASRLGLSQTQQSIDFGRQHPSHPMHYLHQDAEMMDKLGQWFKQAFGTEIAIDHLAGSAIPLHVALGVAPKDGESVLSKEYRERLLSSPRLDAQGDGMRSFVGLLMHVLLGYQSVFLVDEPEAFLHPPQARLLGRLLAENHRGGQVFVATHSSDFLRGLLDARGCSVRVIRLTRRGDTNHACELDPSGVREVWTDPVLRYSNILDGAFHEKVVICEAEGDCRFYSAMADSVREQGDDLFVRDVMFAQSGGKGGIPKLIKALKSLDVSVAAVVDFDALCSTGQLRAIIEALGGDWSAYDADYRTVKASIDSLGKVPAATFKAKLHALADGIDNAAIEISPKAISGLRALLKVSVGNSRAKESGVGVLGRDAKAPADRLLHALADLGLFVVPTGELESFVPQESAEKNAWVAMVLEKYGANLRTADELAKAREFVARIIKA